MGKETGLGARFLIGGYDISGSVAALSRINGGPATQDANDITQSGMARLGLLRDGGMEVVSFWDPSTANGAHARLKTLPTAATQTMYMHRQTLGVPAACCIGRQLDYKPNRGADGSLTCTSEVLADGYGLEWGTLLTAGVRTDTAATNGTGVDFAAAGTNGLQAYVQVTAFTGTSITIKLQQSSDNGGADAFADLAGAAFTAVTAAPATERIAVTGNIERYLRVATTGTFSSATFAVMVAFNESATAF